MKWLEANLLAICKPKQWPTISGKDLTEAGYPVYGANGRIGFYSAYNHEHPTILVTCRGATCGTLNICSPKSYVTGNAMSLDEPDTNLVEMKFLYFALLARGLKDTITGAAQPQITRANLAKVKVPLPVPREQRRIVELLEQADGLRRRRTEADQLADRILPALFHKMFGDPATNSKNWPKQALGSAGAAVRYGLGQPPQSSDSGLPLIRATNIHRGLITSEDMIYVRREDVPESRNAFLKAEEVIVVRSGAYTGDIAQVTERWAGSVAGYDLVVTPGKRFTGEFIESYLLTSLIQRNYFGNIKARAGQPHLNADQLLNTPMMLPSKPLQEKFSELVNALRSQRVQRTESEKHLNDLFSTMLHRAFTGELTAKWQEAHLKELLTEMEQQARLLRTASENN